MVGAVRAAEVAEENHLSTKHLDDRVVAADLDVIERDLALAGLLEAERDSAGALAALERAAWITPFDAALQARLGALAFARRVSAPAIRARRAVVALAPADRALAWFELAQAYAAAHDAASARREVLRALDLAPNFEAAQELLLSLRTSGKAP